MSPVASSRVGVCKLFTIAHESPGFVVQHAVCFAQYTANVDEDEGIARRTQSDGTSYGNPPAAYSFHGKGILCEPKNLSL